MKRVLVTGGTGFVGRALVPALLTRGDEVTIVSRRGGGAADGSGVKAIGWDAVPQAIEGMDAVVHLAGEPVARRWTDEGRRRIRESRVDTTRKLVEAIGAATKRPSVFVCASAIGFYGDREGDVELAEDAPAGSDFLAGVVVDWEHEAQKAADHGVRHVELRIGIVLDRGGGALAEMTLPFKMFAGGPVGDGRQVVSWIHRDDVVGLVLVAIDDARASGPINATAPNAVTSKELAAAIGRAMKRPSWLAVPKFALRLRFGEAAEALLAGARVIPARARALGYEFRYGEVDAALNRALGRPS